MIVRRGVLAGAGAAIACLGLGPTAVRAAQPMLTLRGRFAKAEPSGETRSSIADLDALPQTAFATSTPWHKGVVKFSGVRLKDYFTYFGADPKLIRLVALNDYAVEAAVTDLVAGGALLATRQNDQLMPISDKGPVFLIFPFDSRSELQHQAYYSRCVWQLTEIDIVA